jgi:hypothetical protein
MLGAFARCGRWQLYRHLARRNSRDRYPQEELTRPQDIGPTAIWANSIAPDMVGLDPALAALDFEKAPAVLAVGDPPDDARLGAIGDPRRLNNRAAIQPCVPSGSSILRHVSKRATTFTGRSLRRYSHITGTSGDGPLRIRASSTLIDAQ